MKGKKKERKKKPTNLNAFSPAAPTQWPAGWGARKKGREITCIHGTIYILADSIRWDLPPFSSSLFTGFVFVILPFSRSFHLKIPFFLETKSGGDPVSYLFYLPTSSRPHLLSLPTPAQPNLLLLCLRYMNATVSNYLLIFFWRIKKWKKKKITFQGVANRSNCLSTFPV